MAVICQMKLELGGKQLLAFSTEEFDERAQPVFDDLRIQSFSFSLVWDTFQTMLPFLFAGY